MDKTALVRKLRTTPIGQMRTPGRLSDSPPPRVAWLRPYAWDGVLFPEVCNPLFSDQAKATPVMESAKDEATSMTVSQQSVLSAWFIYRINQDG